MREGSFVGNHLKLTSTWRAACLAETNQTENACDSTDMCKWNKRKEKCEYNPTVRRPATTTPPNNDDDDDDDE